MCKNTKKFDMKTFEIDFVIEIKWYLTFLPIPRAQWEGLEKMLLHAPIAQLVERPLSEREVVGSNPSRTIPKV